MADETDSEQGNGADESHGPRECMPCRGTGTVISSLGGTPTQVPCPWCSGSGERTADVDAQAAWPANEPPAAAAEVPPADEPPAS